MLGTQYLGFGLGGQITKWFQGETLLPQGMMGDKFDLLWIVTISVARRLTFMTQYLGRINVLSQRGTAVLWKKLVM